ncbi:MAG TPA: aminotransferase class III-fold pyridoxal phosphate-dependent enzyme [Actinomycetota bacterium]
MTPVLAGESAVMPTYARFPLTLVRGTGVRVTDDEGRTYLDLVGGLGALSLGHAHPRWVAAVEDAARTLGLTSNLFATPPQAALAARLASILPVEDARVFFCNSGTEANEALLKLVRKQGLADGHGVIVTLEGSFHGRTIGSLAATGQPSKRAAFEPLIEWIRFVPPGDEDAMRAELARGDVAAVLLEPVLGEGGVIPLAVDYLRTVRALCDEHGALFAVDEVQAGTGRCGAWLSIELADVRPDVVSLAKALGGGLPIGALVAPAAISFGPGDHASTFGGGPVPSAAALAVLDTIDEEGLLAHVDDMGTFLRDEVTRLAPAGALREVRGRGLLCGFQLAEGLLPDAVLAALRARGVLASQAGVDAVRFTPPYVIGRPDVEEAAVALAGALEEVAA